MQNLNELITIILKDFIQEKEIGLYIDERTHLIYGTFESTDFESNLWQLKSFEIFPDEILRDANGKYLASQKLRIFLYPQTFSYMYYSFYQNRHRSHHDRKKNKNDIVFSFKQYARKYTLEFIKRVLNDNNTDPFQWHLFGETAIKLDLENDTIEFHDLKANEFDSEPIFQDGSFSFPEDYEIEAEFKLMDGEIEYWVDGKKEDTPNTFDICDIMFYKIGKKYRPQKIPN